MNPRVHSLRCLEFIVSGRRVHSFRLGTMFPRVHSFRLETLWARVHSFRRQGQSVDRSAIAAAALGSLGEITEFDQAPELPRHPRLRQPEGVGELAGTGAGIRPVRVGEVVQREQQAQLGKGQAGITRDGPPPPIAHVLSGTPAMLGTGVDGSPRVPRFPAGAAAIYGSVHPAPPPARNSAAIRSRCSSVSGGASATTRATCSSSLRARMFRRASISSGSSAGRDRDRDA